MLPTSEKPKDSSAGTWFSEFELEVTPELCGAYRSALDRRLAQFVPIHPDYRGIPGQLQGRLPNMRWFMRNGCDVGPQVSRLAAAAAALMPDHYSPSYAQELEAVAREGVRGEMAGG